MSDEMMTTFEKLWIALRAAWCDNHDLNGALAFSHDRAAMDFFHRIVQVNVDDTQVDRLIDDAICLFQEKKYDCMFTLSPLDRPANLSKRLERRGFTEGMLASAMVYDPPTAPPPPKLLRKLMSRLMESMTFGRMSCVVDSVMTRQWERLDAMC